jgi:hypothetical protein
MDEHIASLSLVARIRPGFGDPANGGPYKTQRRFFDFIVNGVSLYEAAGRDRDLVSLLWGEPADSAVLAAALQRLLASEPGDASDGRVSLLICPECGDLGCGAVTVRIDTSPRNIIWRDFGYENNDQPEIERAAFASFGPFIFDREAYSAELRALLPRLI